MAATVNGSFASPRAMADHAAISSTDSGLLSAVYNGIGGLSITITVLLILIAYDQCEWPLYPLLLPVADLNRSQIYLEQRINCRTVVENALHWALLVIGEPQDGRIQGEMGKWGIELCFRLP